MKFDHIGMIVKDLDASLKNFTSKLGLEVEEIGEVELSGERARQAMLRIGESKIELIESKAEKGLAADFLREHGEGIHHVAIQVEGIDNMFKDLSSRGVKFIWGEVFQTDPKTKIAFFDAEEFNSVLFQLVEKR